MKVVLWMAISLNGIIATPDNKEDFLSHENWKEFVRAVKKRGCLIWGRKAYQVVRGWDSSYLAPFEKITKIIISRNPKLQLDQGFILANSPHEALKILKARGFKEVILTGGAKINSAFAERGLIDEIIVDVEGVVVGNGINLFSPQDFELSLQLMKLKKVSSNIVQLHYKVIKK